MSGKPKDYEVGYGKPPKSGQFQKGNQMARRRKPSTEPQDISMGHLIRNALLKKQKATRGDTTVDMSGAEILTERVIQIVAKGSPREVMQMAGLIHRIMAIEPKPDPEPPVMTITYERAETSQVALPPPELCNSGENK